MMAKSLRAVRGVELDGLIPCDGIQRLFFRCDHISSKSNIFTLWPTAQIFTTLALSLDVPVSGALAARTDRADWNP